MYRFPPIDELRYLIGATLARIVVDPYQVSFYLTDDRATTTLTSGYAFEFKRSNGQTEAHRPDQKSSNFGASHLHEMLDDTVVDIDLSADDLRLCLGFARGSQLTILTQVNGYESGTIACGGGSQKFWVF
jgi:hypothetical protein